ncbi:hypothetical protein B0H11DRAFT_2296786 [Mycena galericulata]|nr:hypothetical protein B0H11DRAFT_2296786 [Mycena galericulata]
MPIQHNNTRISTEDPPGAREGFGDMVHPSRQPAGYEFRDDKRGAATLFPSKPSAHDYLEFRLTVPLTSLLHLLPSQQNEALLGSGTLLAPVDHPITYFCLILPTTFHLVSMLQSELARLHNRLDHLEFGQTAASTLRGHHWRPAWTGDSPDRYSCTLVVPDSVVGHIVGRGGKGLHQAHDVSGAQLRAYADKALPSERRVSIRGTDQQVGEALIALGKRLMRKRVRAKKKGLSQGFCTSSCSPSPRSHQNDTAAAGNRAPVFPPLGLGTGAPFHCDRPSQTGKQVKFAPKQSSSAAAYPLPRVPAAAPFPTPMPGMAPPPPIFPHAPSTPFVPSVAMPTALPSPAPSSTAAYGSPMAIDAVTTSGRRRQTARRGGAPAPHLVRTVGDNIYFPGDPEY